MVTNIYRNIPTEEKIKIYLRFCDYLTKEQIQGKREKDCGMEKRVGAGLEVENGNIEKDKRAEEADGTEHGEKLP